jgi:hypothetical protein
VQNRRLLQTFSVAVLGFALACAPMSLASAKSQPKKHHKAPKHQTAKKPTTKKESFTAGSATCKNYLNTETGSSGLAAALEKAMLNAGSGFAGVKQAFINYLNTVQTYEKPFEADLSSAPANVQAAGKGIFAFFGTLQTDIENSTSLAQLGSSMETLGSNSALQSDAETLANYFGSICGAVPTTTVSVP